MKKSPEQMVPANEKEVRRLRIRLTLTIRFKAYRLTLTISF